MKPHGRTNGETGRPRSRALCVMETLGVIFAFVVLHAVMGEPLRNLDPLIQMVKDTTFSIAGTPTNSTGFSFTHTILRLPSQHQKNGEGGTSTAERRPYVCEGLTSELPAVKFIDVQQHQADVRPLLVRVPLFRGPTNSHVHLMATIIAACCNVGVRRAECSRA